MSCLERKNLDDSPALMAALVKLHIAKSNIDVKKIILCVVEILKHKKVV